MARSMGLIHVVGRLTSGRTEKSRSWERLFCSFQVRWINTETQQKR
jgi:hypothetical protein